MKVHAESLRLRREHDVQCSHLYFMMLVVLSDWALTLALCLFAYFCFLAANTNILPSLHLHTIIITMKISVPLSFLVCLPFMAMANESSSNPEWVRADIQDQATVDAKAGQEGSLLRGRMLGVEHSSKADKDASMPKTAKTPKRMLEDSSKAEKHEGSVSTKTLKRMLEDSSKAEKHEGSTPK
jgi:hypothetical protein